MKKIMLSIVIALLLSTMFIPAAFGSTPSPRIYFGQDMFGGVVKITPNANGSITLLYMMRGGEGWCMTESHVHVGLSLDDFPTDPTRPGHFDFHVYGPDAPCTSNFSITIWPDPADPQWAHGDHIYMAIHVVGNNPWLGLFEETGWTVRCGMMDNHFFTDDMWSSGLWLEILPSEWE